jgi:hypothetical protein
MAQEGGNTVPRITKAEHIGPNDTGDNVEAKRVANYVWNGTAWERQGTTSGSTGLTDAELRATPVPVSMSGSATSAKQDSMISLLDDGTTFTKKTVTASSSGNNTIHTPASGNKIRLYFFGYSAGSNVTGVLCGLKFTTSGTVFDYQYLTAAGQPYARNIQAGKRYIDGGIDEALVLNLNGAQTVYCNIEVEEI